MSNYNHNNDEGYDDYLEDDYRGGYYDDDGYTDGVGDGFQDGHGDYGDEEFEQDDEEGNHYEVRGQDEVRVDDEYDGLNDHGGDGYEDRSGGHSLNRRDEFRYQEADPRYLDERYGNDGQQAVDEDEEDLDQGDDVHQEEAYDERFGYGHQHEESPDQGYDGIGYQGDQEPGLYVPPQHREQEDEDYDPEQHDDRSYDRDDRSEDSAGRMGEGIKSYTVGVDEEYEAMEEMFRQGPAEYGGGDTMDDDNEDYSNTLYRPPRVRTQMRRDREASMRRSRQQRGRRGPDAEERGHD